MIHTYEHLPGMLFALHPMVTSKLHWSRIMRSKYIATPIPSTLLLVVQTLLRIMFTAVGAPQLH